MSGWLFFSLLAIGGGINWLLVGQFSAALKTHGVDLLPKDEPLRRHIFSELNFIRYLVTRSYTKVPDPSVQMWGDVLLAWLAGICVVVVPLLIFCRPVLKF
jgi:hypothetical protein